MIRSRFRAPLQRLPCETLGVCFAEKVTAEAMDRFLAHGPADMIENSTFPDPGFVEEMMRGRRDSAPGPDGLWFAACLAAGPKFDGALEAHLKRLWDGGCFTDDDRSAVACFIPKTATADTRVFARGPSHHHDEHNVQAGSPLRQLVPGRGPAQVCGRPPERLHEGPPGR